MNVLELSKNNAFVSTKLAFAAGKKCKELGADGFFITLYEDKGCDSGEKKVVVSFVKQPTVDEFDYIQEAMNPLADIFMWSEVVKSLTPKDSLGRVIFDEE